MGQTLNRHHLPAFANLSPDEEGALVESARTLQKASVSGHTQPLLRGKNLGLLCDDDTQPEAVLFRRAATELGAHVAHVAMSLSACSSTLEVAHTARMLGRLYDAVECQGMASSLVQQVADDAGVAVYDGIATQAHPSARLADQLGRAASPADNRRFVLQALLLSTIV